MAKYLEDDRLGLDILDKSGRNGNGDILYTKEAWLGSAILDLLGGESLIRTMAKVELAEDIVILLGDI